MKVSASQRPLPPRDPRMAAPYSPTVQGQGKAALKRPETPTFEPGSLDEPGRRTRMGGLDGLRAIAAISVLLYHLVPFVMPHGFAGVDMFFVLSGFLITSLLADRLRRDGKVSLSQFWVRRFRRLVPAVLTVTIVSLAGAFVVGGDALVALPRQTFGAVTGTYNWVEISSGTSYFEHASPLLLTNMWSLAVEQQFYIVWPVIVMILALYPARRVAIGVSMGIAAASIGLHLWFMSEDVSRAYMGTDSHLWGLMAGAVLAFAVPGALEGLAPARPHGRRWAVLGWAGLIAAPTLMIVTPERWMYPWGMVGISLITMVIIRGLMSDAGATASGRALRGFLEWAPLRWLGERSYGIYLWHWPVWVLLFYLAPLADVWAVAAIVTVVSIVAAALSYRFIETPIRVHGFRVWVAGAVRSLSGNSRVKVVAGVLTLALIMVAAGAALLTSTATSSAERAVASGAAAPVVHVNEPATAPAGDGRDTDDSRDSADPAQGAGADEVGEPAPHTRDNSEPITQDEERITRDEETSEPRGPEVSGDSVTIIGDSLAVAATPALSERFPGVSVDADISRSIAAAPGLVQRLKAQGNLRYYVVIALATNATITQRDIQAVKDAAGAEHVFIFVTGFGPPRTTWIPEANATIREAAASDPQIVVADWHAAISAQPELLAGDAVHPAGPEGAALYARVIDDALEQARAR